MDWRTCVSVFLFVSLCTTSRSQVEILCSDSQLLAIQQSFQNRSHQILVSVYEASLQMENNLPRTPENTNLLTGKLCKALTDICTLCVKHLKECFARDDLIQIKRSALAELKDFLIRIVNRKVRKDALDDCKAGLDAMDTLQLEEYDEEDLTLTSSIQPEIVQVGKEDFEEKESSEKDESENVMDEENAVDSAASEVVSTKDDRSEKEVTTKMEQ